MSQRKGCEQRLRELIDIDVPAGKLKRLARVDALLRKAVAADKALGTLPPRDELLTTRSSV